MLTTLTFFYHVYLCTSQWTGGLSLTALILPDYFRFCGRNSEVCRSRVMASTKKANFATYVIKIVMVFEEVIVRLSDRNDQKVLSRAKKQLLFQRAVCVTGWTERSESGIVRICKRLKTYSLEFARRPKPTKFGGIPLPQDVFILWIWISMVVNVICNCPG